MTNNNRSLIVRVISPKGLLYSGQAKSVSSVNSAGNFDILPEHANFITIIKNSPVIIRTSKDEVVKFDLDLSVLYTSNNNVNIYTQIQPITIDGLN